MVKISDLPHQPTTREYDSQASAKQLNDALNREPAKQRRDRIAEGFAFAIIASGLTMPHTDTAECAADMADALIAELDRT